MQCLGNRCPSGRGRLSSPLAVLLDEVDTPAKPRLLPWIGPFPRSYARCYPLPSGATKDAAGAYGWVLFGAMNANSGIGLPSWAVRIGRGRI